MTSHLSVSFGFSSFTHILSFCAGQHAKVAALLQLYKPDVYAVNEYGQTPVSLGTILFLVRLKRVQPLAFVLFNKV